MAAMGGGAGKGAATSTASSAATKTAAQQATQKAQTAQTQTLGQRISQQQSSSAGQTAMPTSGPVSRGAQSFSTDRELLGEMMGTLIAGANDPGTLKEAGSGLVYRASGGPVAAGQPAVVGENGPEVIRPTKDIEVTPMTGSTAKWAAEQGGPLNFIKGIGKGILNATAYGRQINEERQRRRVGALTDAIVNQPELIRDPFVRKELSNYFGGEEVGDLIAAARSADPNVLENAIKQIEGMVGLSPEDATIGGMAAPEPGAGKGYGVLSPEATAGRPMNQAERIGRIQENLPPGGSLDYNPSKGELKVGFTGKTKEDRFEQAFDKVFAEELTKANGDVDEAAIRATVRSSLELGVSDMPKWAQDVLTVGMRMGEEQQKSDIQETREKALAKFRNKMDLDSKRKMAMEAEVGQREGALAKPKTPEESRAAEAYAKAGTQAPAKITTPLPASEIKEVEARQTSLNQLSSVFEALDPAQLGPLAGRFTTMSEALGQLGFEETKFQALIDDALRAERRLVTGQAAGEKELAEMRRTVLNTNMAPEQFLARLTALTERSMNAAKTYSGTLEKQGYTSPDFQIGDRLQKFVAERGTNPKMTALGADPVNDEISEFYKKNPHLAPAQVKGVLQ